MEGSTGEDARRGRDGNGVSVEDPFTVQTQSGTLPLSPQAYRHPPNHFPSSHAWASTQMLTLSDTEREREREREETDRGTQPKVKTWMDTLKKLERGDQRERLRERGNGASDEARLRSRGEG